MRHSIRSWSTPCPIGDRGHRGHRGAPDHLVRRRDGRWENADHLIAGRVPPGIRRLLRHLSSHVGEVQRLQARDGVSSEGHLQSPGVLNYRVPPQDPETLLLPLPRPRPRALPAVSAHSPDAARATSSSTALSVVYDGENQVAATRRSSRLRLGYSVGIVGATGAGKSTRRSIFCCGFYDVCREGIWWMVDVVGHTDLPRRWPGSKGTPGRTRSRGPSPRIRLARTRSSAPWRGKRPPPGRTRGPVHRSTGRRRQRGGVSGRHAVGRPEAVAVVRAGARLRTARF